MHRYNDIDFENHPELTTPYLQARAVKKENEYLALVDKQRIQKDRSFAMARINEQKMREKEVLQENLEKQAKELYKANKDRLFEGINDFRPSVANNNNQIQGNSNKIEEMRRLDSKPKNKPSFVKSDDYYGDRALIKKPPINPFKNKPERKVKENKSNLKKGKTIDKSAKTTQESIVTKDSTELAYDKNGGLIEQPVFYQQKMQEEFLKKIEEQNIGEKNRLRKEKAQMSNMNNLLQGQSKIMADLLSAYQENQTQSKQNKYRPPEADILDLEMRFDAAERQNEAIRKVNEARDMINNYSNQASVARFAGQYHKHNMQNALDHFQKEIASMKKNQPRVIQGEKGKLRNAGIRSLTNFNRKEQVPAPHQNIKKQSSSESSSENSSEDETLPPQDYVPKFTEAEVKKMVDLKLKEEIEKVVSARNNGIQNSEMLNRRLKELAKKQQIIPISSNKKDSNSESSTSSKITHQRNNYAGSEPLEKNLQQMMMMNFMNKMMKPRANRDQSSYTESDDDSSSITETQQIVDLRSSKTSKNLTDNSTRRNTAPSIIDDRKLIIQELHPPYIDTNADNLEQIENDPLFRDAKPFIPFKPVEFDDIPEMPVISTLIIKIEIPTPRMSYRRPKPTTIADTDSDIDKTRSGNYPSNPPVIRDDPVKELSTM